MPVVTIEMWEGRTASQKETLIKEVTEAVCRSLSIEREEVTVVLHDVPKANWGRNGEQASKIRKR